MALRRQHAAKVVEIRREYVKGNGLFNTGQEPTTLAYHGERERYRADQRAAHPYESCRYTGTASGGATQRGVEV